jgi:16S rRNA (adenine1518-N6/adenine1519-N6)-dimethyltransferase
MSNTSMPMPKLTRQANSRHRAPLGSDLTENMQHRARKRFGQNFLVDNHIIDRIVSSIRPTRSDTMVEIGPGLGALTRPLCAQLDRLEVIELDRDLVQRLEQAHYDGCTLNIHNADALAFDFTALSAQTCGGQKLRIVGNLPYNISTPLLFHLIDHRAVIHDMHFMLQKEVVERIAAQPGTRNYGRLSVMIQFYCAVAPLFSVPSSAFKPAPKVESAIVRLIPEQFPGAETLDHTLLETLVRQAFSQRRKTLRNTLKGLCSEEQIQQAGIRPQSRPEELSVSDYVNLLHQIETPQT